MEYISSRTNNQIKNIVNLVNNKKERIKQGLFVIEGLKILIEAKKNKINILKIFTTQKFFDNNRNIFEKIVNKDIEIIIIVEDICKKISNNVTPQEIFAICKIPSEISFDIALNNGRNILMVLNLQDTGNFGTIIRTANAFGIDYILKSKDCPDIYSPKMLRSSMGNVFNSNIIEIDDPIKTINMLKKSGFNIYASAISDNCEEIQTISFSDKNVIIVGNEGNGLNKDIIKAADKSVKIPMIKKIESLNVSIAAAILLWELKKNKINDYN